MTDSPGNIRNGKENRSAFSGLVRMVSMSNKSKDGSNKVSNRGVSRAMSNASTTSSTSSAGYQSLSAGSPSKSTNRPGVAASTHEHVVWGPPPAMKTSRTIEGIELVDENRPVSINGQSSNESSISGSKATSSPRKSSVQRRASAKAPHRTITPIPIPNDIEELSESEYPERLQSRRSIDSLMPSAQAHVPLPAYSELEFPHTLDDGILQRVNSPSTGHNVARRNQRLSLGISSTSRAAPAGEVSLPDSFSSPYQGFWSVHRSDEGEDNKQSEADRLRELFQQSKDPLWAVSRGWKKGIFATFEEAEKQTRNFPGPLIRQFANVDEAIEFLEASSKSPLIMDEDKDYAARFASTALRKPAFQRQISLQSTSTVQTNGALNRVLRSPSTNPFLNRAEDLQSPWSASRSASHSVSPGTPLLVSIEKAQEQKDKKRNEGETSSEHDFLTPTSTLENDLPTAPIITTIFTCRDLDETVECYTKLLEFRVIEGTRHEDQILLAYKDSRHASLTLRKGHSHLENTMKSFHPSSCMIAVEYDELKKIHSSVTLKLKEMEVPPGCRLSEVEVKPWASSECAFTDATGNTIVFSALTH